LQIDKSIGEPACVVGAGVVWSGVGMLASPLAGKQL